jgi:transposase
LLHGDKSFVGKKGYRRFLKTQGAHFTIDEAKVEDDARYDGRWVLRTDTTYEPMVVALAYEQLWMVEALFRSMKSWLDTRPVYHQTDRCIRGYVFCSFLALVLRQELQRRLAAKRWSLEWADVVRDLGQLHETTIAIQDHQYVVRSETKGTVGKVFQACGVAIPPGLRPACREPATPFKKLDRRDTTRNRRP